MIGNTYLGILITSTQTMALATMVFTVLAFLIYKSDQLKKSNWIFYLSLLTIQIGYIILNWGRMGRPYTDFGMMLYMPTRILEGRLYYDEITLGTYGPFSAHFHALLYKIFGIHTSVLQVTASITNVIIFSLFYFIASKLIKPLLSLCAGAIFLAFCFSSEYLSMPYAFAAQYSLLFFLATLALVPYYLKHRNFRSILYLVIFSSLGGLSKQNYGFFVFVGLWIFVVLDLFVFSAKTDITTKRKISMLSTLTLGTGLLTAIPYLILIIKASRNVFSESILYVRAAKYLSRTYLDVLFTDILPSKLSTPLQFNIQTLQSAAFHGVLLLALIGSVYRLIKLYRKKDFNLEYRYATCIVLISLFLILAFTHKMHEAYQGASWILLALWCLSCLSIMQKPVGNNLEKIIVIIFVSASIGIGTYNFRWTNTKKFLLQSDQVSLYEASQYGKPLDEIAKYTRKHAKADDKLFVTSTQNILYMLTDLRSPVRFNCINFPGYVSKKDEQEIVDVLQKTQTRFIVVRTDPLVSSGFMSKVGVQELWIDRGFDPDVDLKFGQDFAKIFWAHLEANYHIALESGYLTLYELN